MTPSILKTNALKVKCSHNVYKNWPLGHGEYRISGNIGPLVPIVHEAKQNGFDDVLWLLDDFVKEMTILNVFILKKSRYGEVELITPDVDGCIFNHVLRQSIVEMTDKWKREKGIRLVERQISIHEILNAYHEKRLLEIFGVSASSFIRPFSLLVYKD